jgi:hypothetical protein
VKFLSPEEAADEIHSGRFRGPAKISGKLDLTNFQGETLPAGLHCYELDASGSSLKQLPSDIQIDGRLVLDNSKVLRTLPKGLRAGSISLRNCQLLERLPENLSTWFLDMSGCARFEHWPENASIENGALNLRECVRISYLPSWIRRLSQLNLAGCVQLKTIPEGLLVSSWVDVGGSGVIGLPSSLRHASLRWRGVRVDERVAFHPEQLTARDALAEKNTEVRRIMIERIGYLRFARESEAKILDQDRDAGGPRQLLFIHLDEDEPLVGLLCQCPSTGRRYFLRVPPDMNSCHQAAAWVAGFDDPSMYQPKIET